MTQKRKPPNAGLGRKLGVPNKATKNARLAIAAFLEGNTDRLNHLLDEIEQREGPRAAWTCMMQLVERHMPRLKIASRTN